MSQESLIAELTAGLRPVRRMAAPGWQALGWVGFAGLVILVAVLWHGLRHDLAQRMLLPHEVAQWVAAVLTGVAAAFAAALLARPDRSDGWVLLPLPFAAMWMGSLGWGCLVDLWRIGDAALQPDFSWSCLRFTVGVGLPLTAALLLLLRHAGLVRPGPVLGLAGLAAAALCSAGLSLFHHLDAAAEVLVSHGVAIGAVALIGRVGGRGLLARPR